MPCNIRSCCKFSFTCKELDIIYTRGSHCCSVLRKGCAFDSSNTTLVVISTGCTSNCKSNYHTITTTMSPPPKHDMKYVILCNEFSSFLVCIFFIYFFFFGISKPFPYFDVNRLMM